MPRYNHELVLSLQAEFGVTLEFPCAPGDVKNATRISGECTEDGCLERFEKDLRKLHKNKLPYCPAHAKNYIADKMKATLEQKHQDGEGTRRKYNAGLLRELESQHGISLRCCDDDLTKLNAYSRICGVCVEPGCHTEFEKPFRKLVQNGLCLCDAHTKQVAYENSCETNMKNLGVMHAPQHPDIAEKIDKNSFKHKTYTFCSGETLSCQGYEPFALSLLEHSGYDASDIITRKKDVPEVWYTFQMDIAKKPHRYYMDIYLPALKMAIEVKSYLYFIQNFEKIIESRKAVHKLGMKYLLWIFDAKGNLVQTPTNQLLADPKYSKINLVKYY